jgi:hypothetical protein
MSTRPSKRMSILGGALLIGIGILILLGEIFQGFDFWGVFWPFILITVGVLFFASMLAGGKSAAGLAIPGSIITCLGLMMFIQNLTNHWESWAYSWSVIIFSIGLGIYIKGVYADQESSRRSGGRLMRLAFILFIIFGIFFEMLFSSRETASYVFPIAMIALGLYLLVIRSGLLPERRRESPPQAGPPSQAESTPETETTLHQQ